MLIPKHIFISQIEMARPSSEVERRTGFAILSYFQTEVWGENLDSSPSEFQNSGLLKDAAE